MAIGYLFTPGAIGGTVAAVVGITAIIMKNREKGRTWLTEKFGKKWEENIIIQFFGWPLIAVGLLMYLPDHFWMDCIKLGIAFAMFVLWRIWKKKTAAKKAATFEEAVPSEHFDEKADSVIS